MKRRFSPGASTALRRVANTGSSTLPTLPASGRIVASAAGRLHARPRPRKRPRSVSHSQAPSPTTACATAGCASSALRGRRVATRISRPGSRAVWTNSFENAGCAASASAAFRTSSRQPVTSMRRARSVRFVSVMQRSSASCPGATHTSSRVSMPWSRWSQPNSPGSANTVPCAGGREDDGWSSGHVRPRSRSRSQKRQPSASSMRSALQRDSALPCQLDRPVPASVSHTE